MYFSHYLNHHNYCSACTCCLSIFKSYEINFKTYLCVYLLLLFPLFFLCKSFSMYMYLCVTLYLSIYVCACFMFISNNTSRTVTIVIKLQLQKN